MGRKKKHPIAMESEVVAALLARNATSETFDIKNIVARLEDLVKYLGRFRFQSVVEPLAGLMTRPENHPATSRFEALVHLAAIYCRGAREPNSRQLQAWLNSAISRDPIFELEIPIEDVFVSNVATWFGNTRMFEGRWHNNGDFVRSCLDALLRSLDEPWASQALRNIRALLLVSETLARRAGVDRNSRTSSRPKDTVRVTVSSLKQSRGHVSFSDHELVSLGVDPIALEPFVFREEHRELLVGQKIGHSLLERRPLVRFEGRTSVVLPTAIGTAIRRFAIEQAEAAGCLQLFQSTFDLAQFTDVFLLGQPNWNVRYIELIDQSNDDGIREFIGSFDEGSYFYLLFVPDNFTEVIKNGLSSIHELTSAITNRIQEQVTHLSKRQDHIRGVAVLAHGGIGRHFSPVWAEMPPGWHQICLSVPDLLFLGNVDDFTAMRAWKLLQRVDDLLEENVVYPNLGGFLNLTAFGYSVDFELVPINMGFQTIYLHSDLVLPLRHHVRNAVDRHAVLGPDGENWIEVQRETSNLGFNELNNAPIYFHGELRARRMFLECVVSGERVWWVRCEEIPDDDWSREIVFGVLNVIRGWLVRVAPEMENRISTLVEGPITYRVKFSDIKSFNQRNPQIIESSVGPTVFLEEGEIVIDCEPSYLRSFLIEGNLGDRLAIMALIRGAQLLSGESAPSDEVAEKTLLKVVGSESARFFNMTPSESTQDLIYDAATLPQPRLLAPEDRAWSRVGLAHRAGYLSDPGPIPSHEVDCVLNRAVDCVWKRVQSCLVRLNRESVIERTLLNYVAVRKDHRDWMRSMAAQFELYKSSEVIGVAQSRVARNDAVTLTSRVAAEMSLCTSPYGTGTTCTSTDLDFLLAEISTLIECAVWSDGHYYGLMTELPVMYSNGSFDVERWRAGSASPLLKERWAREFHTLSESSFVNSNSIELDDRDSKFQKAFLAEFLLSTDQFANFAHNLAIDAIETNTAHKRIRKSELLQRLRELLVEEPEQAFERLVLKPRKCWDEKNPTGAKERDWYPWRYNRRLSILRRPLVQLSFEKDPIVLVFPSILAESLNYLCSSVDGRLPEELFDSREMISYIGRAADVIGHEFNCRVANRLNKLGWEARRELSLTELGGKDELGDIDVLAWQPSTGLVTATECKSLRFDRTLGEIGERLKDYAVGANDGQPTALQRHLDRMAYLNRNPDQLSSLTGIPVGLLRVRSALVTERLSPMQFESKIRDVMDIVTDYDLIEGTFGNLQ